VKMLEEPDGELGGDGEWGDDLFDDDYDDDY
jgi:hypothetical protein